MVEVIDAKIFVEGIETRDPMLIGLAILDMVENIKDLDISIES